MEPVTLDGFEIKKLYFKRVAAEVEKISMDFDPYSNNNVVTIIRRMSYFPGTSQRKTMKGAAVRAPTIATATLPFGLGYRPTDEDLLEMELKKTAHAKAKANGFPSLLEPLRLYTSTLDGKFIKDGDY